MVSGFVTSPRDHSRISSAETRPMEIFSSLLISMSRSKPCTLYSPLSSSSLAVAGSRASEESAGPRILALTRKGVRPFVQATRGLLAAEVDPQRTRSLVPVAPVLILGCSLGVVDGLYREPQRLHLLEQDLEARRYPGLWDVLSLDDRLVALDPADPVVALYGEQLLQRVRSAIGFERPHLHLAEALPAELGLTTQRLLRHERVRAGAPRVDLIVHQVQELQYVHVADGDPAVERLAGPPVVERYLAASAHADVGAAILADRLDGLVH